MEKYSKYLWAVTILIFVTFIGIMSYWYPVTLDEYYRWDYPFEWRTITYAYLYVVPRISVLFTIPVFAFGKWFFILLNSLIQLANCLCLFYILFVRLPDIKSLKDMPYFTMILLMSIFFVCTPSQVMFWVSGAINYTWSISFFLFMLCFLRQIQTNKIIFKDNCLFKILFFILGFIVGMSNECLSPIALGLTVCFGLFCEYKKIKSPRNLSWLIFGLAFGCLIFFTAPAHYHKMSLGIIANVSSVSLSKKLFFHIYHLNKFFEAQFYLFIITVLFLIVGFIDKDKKAISKNDLLISLIGLILSFAMAFVLFVVPQPPLRAYYPASIACLISFLFLVKYYIEAYKFDFSKWLCYLVFLVCLSLTPRFILPHYSLYVQTKSHNYLQNLSTPYMVLIGPTENLSIAFMDPARKRQIDTNVWATDFSPLINW